MASKRRTYVVAGFESCKYRQKTVELLTTLSKSDSENFNPPVLKIFPTREEYHQWLDTDDKHPKDSERAMKHRTSPFVFELETKRFVGGHSDTVAEVQPSKL